MVGRAPVLGMILMIPTLHQGKVPDLIPMILTIAKDLDLILMIPMPLVMTPMIPMVERGLVLDMTLMIPTVAKDQHMTPMTLTILHPEKDPNTTPTIPMLGY